jgi:hypothetical protein
MDKRMPYIKDIKKRWMFEKDHILYMASIGCDGIDDSWTWKMLLWWVSPDLWDDKTTLMGFNFWDEGEESA